MVISAALEETEIAVQALGIEEWFSKLPHGNVTFHRF